MKPGQSIFLIIVVAAIIVFVISFTKSCKPPDVDKQEQQLQVLRQQFDSLSHQIQSYKDSLKKYDNAIAVLNLRDLQLSGELQDNRRLQTQIKKEYVQTNRFHSANSAEITKYFADSLY